ncbi:hypothetical protein, partial [Cupriavidus oxalaticus]|uniref:hypothetical protein n=1 Tax=Cupriavidus oxalaticus TaxID=96344 RepID=UPI00316F86F8
RPSHQPDRRTPAVERRRSTGVASLKQDHSCLVVNHGAGDALTHQQQLLTDYRTNLGVAVPAA